MSGQFLNERSVPLVNVGLSGHLMNAEKKALHLGFIFLLKQSFKFVVKF